MPEKKKFVWDSEVKEDQTWDILNPQIAKSVVEVPHTSSAIHTSAISAEKQRKLKKKDSLDELDFEGGEGDLDFEDLLNQFDEEEKKENSAKPPL